MKVQNENVMSLGNSANTNGKKLPYHPWRALHARTADSTSCSPQRCSPLLLFERATLWWNLIDFLISSQPVAQRGQALTWPTPQQSQKLTLAATAKTIHHYHDRRPVLACCCSSNCQLLRLLQLVVIGVKDACRED